MQIGHEGHKKGEEKKRIATKSTQHSRVEWKNFIFKCNFFSNSSHLFVMYFIFKWISFCRRFVCVCACMREFRLNSCENKFKQIVHRLYAFGFAVPFCQPSKWCTTVRVNFLGSSIHIHTPDLHTCSTSWAIKTFTRRSHIACDKIFAHFFRIFQHRFRYHYLKYAAKCICTDRLVIREFTSSILIICASLVKGIETVIHRSRHRFALQERAREIQIPHDSLSMVTNLELQKGIPKKKSNRQKKVKNWTQNWQQRHIPKKNIMAPIISS